MQKYEAERMLPMAWLVAAAAALAGGKTYGGAIQAADHVREAFEERFPVEADDEQ